MYILAFETSCDDTSVALMQDNSLVAMSTRTQLEHGSTGGVVPEVAARSHANAIFPCITEVLSEAQIDIRNIDYFACTDKPGLLPSLLTGMTVAKTLALSLEKPILWVDHIEGHIFANFLERNISDIYFPAVVLTVSGGHTEIYLWKSVFEMQIIGQTRDDAAGEAFDKVSKMMGLGFPGGAKISKLASEYAGNYDGLFPEVLLEKESLDFSFSGLKTAVKREVDRELGREGQLSIEFQRKIAFEFEETVTEILVKKLLRAHKKTQAKSLVLAGGVSANSKLRNKLESYAQRIGIPFFAPVKNLYSMDNAAMVGMRAYYEIFYKH